MGRNIAVAGPFAAVVCSLLLAACSEEPGSAGGTAGSGPRAEAEPVVTRPVAWEARETRVEAVGTSRARQSVTLYPDVSGEVLAVEFSAGEKVEAGQTLLQLEDEEERLAVELAEVELADAVRLRDRYRRTEGVGGVTRNTLDDAESAVERARISLERARVALDDRSVEAPFTGYMGLTTLDPGARIDTVTPIASIDDRSVLLVTFEVPELFHGQLQQGQMVRLSTWGAGSPANRGEIIDIDSRVDPQTRTFAVRARVDNEDDLLRPGMSFRVTLKLEEGRYPVIPEVALQWGGDGAYLWTVEQGRARRVPATVVQRLQGRILIDAELPEGTPVVAEGIQRMREGLPVENVASAFEPQAL